MIVNDMLRPVFFFARLCCTVLNFAMVSFVLEKGTANRNDQSSIGGGSDGIPTPTEKLRNELLSPLKFVTVMPDPCSAAMISSRLVSNPDMTSTLNNTWSG